jgi:hypothetical protein
MIMSGKELYTKTQAIKALQNEFGNQQRTKSSTPDSSQLLLGPSNNHNINHNITNNIEETNNRRTIILRS